MSFDWSFSSPKPGEVSIVDEEAGRIAYDSFFNRLSHFGYELGQPVVSILNDAKIIRIPIFYGETKKLIGQAIKLDKAGKLYEVVQVESIDESSEDYGDTA